MRARIKTLVFGLVALFGAVLLAPGMHAAEAPTSKSALAVSPAILEHVLEPGKPVSFTVQVNNITNFPLPVKAMVRDFTVQFTELEKTERERLDASKWFKIEEPDFILQPNQTRTVKGVILPPPEAEPGGHYATVYFQPLIPHEALSPSTAYMNSQVGVLAFLIVKGDIEQSAEYAKGLTAPGLVQSGPVEFSFSIRNTGNVHLMPAGKLNVYDWRGSLAGQIALPAGVILPNANKEYTLTWDGARLPGQYRAELEVSYGNNNTQLQKISVVVWVMPWMAISFGVVIIIGAAIFVAKTRHRWRKAWRTLHGKDMRFGG